MRQRAASRLAWSVWAAATGLSVAALALVWVNHARASVGHFGPPGFSAIFGLTFTTVGAFIASRRRENLIGWLFLAVGILGGWQEFAEQYAVHGLLVAPGSWPAARLMAWFPAWTWVPSSGLGVIYLFLLFPDGTVPSRRWRVVVVSGAVGIVLAATGFALSPGPLNEFATIGNPLATGSRAVFQALVGLGLLLYAVSGGLAVVSLVLRFRRASGERRLQLKWFVLAAVISTVALLVAILVTSTIAAHRSQSTPLAIGGTTVLAIVLIPLTAGIAILRYRLYDIDLVINKTVVYGLLAAFITAVYVAIVVGIGAALGQGSAKPNLPLSIVATAVVAALFQPVRERVQRLANRLVYGQLATPYEVLSEFSHRMSEAVATEHLLSRMAQTLGEGTGAKEVVVWLTIDDELLPEASWPEEGAVRNALTLGPGGEPPAFEGGLLVPVAHEGETLGAISLTKAAGDRITPAEEKLARELAAGAGMVLRNVRLIEDIRASRARLVRTQDEERRRLERNIHDGAQQHLVALSIKIGLATRLVDRDVEQADAFLDELQAQAEDALETLRDLASGIYPPLLAERGLAVALEAQARRAALPVEIEADAIWRYPQDAEAAAYFCTLEALQNVAKYAHATRAVVRLFEEDGHLAFEVEDDGAGFDTTLTSYGTGMQGMADRLAALGGGLEVRSAPGFGTTVAGRLPLGTIENSRELETVG